MPITTISYNSFAFLRDVLEDLRRAKVISFWFFIVHQPEDDEKKVHIHVYIELSRTLQTDDLVENFVELDPSFPDKPLGVMPFRSSKFEPAYLYAIHDPDFLASRNQTRKYHYDRSQVVTSDDDMLDELVANIDRGKYNAYGDMRKAISKGETFVDFLSHYYVPMNQFNYFKTAFETLSKGGSLTQRNGREGHEPVDLGLAKETFVCTSCGEVFPSLDAVIIQNGKCICRSCLSRQRAVESAGLTAWDVISVKDGDTYRYLNLKTHELFDDLSAYLDDDQIKQWHNINNTTQLNI